MIYSSTTGQVGCKFPVILFPCKMKNLPVTRELGGCFTNSRKVSKYENLKFINCPM